MAEPTLAMTMDDDLPRTVRRERDARERAARERTGPPVHEPVPMPMRAQHDYDLPAPAATVTSIEMPFGKLVLFLIKVVLAGIPALLLLTVLLWGFGHMLQTLFPVLLKMKIMIYVPQ